MAPNGMTVDSWNTGAVIVFDMVQMTAAIVHQRHNIVPDGVESPIFGQIDHLVYIYATVCRIDPVCIVLKHEISTVSSSIALLWFP